MSRKNGRLLKAYPIILENPSDLDLSTIEDLPPVLLENDRLSKDAQLI